MNLTAEKCLDALQAVEWVSYYEPEKGFIAKCLCCDATRHINDNPNHAQDCVLAEMIRRLEAKVDK